MLTILERLTAGGSTDLTATVRAALAAAPGRGLCILISDLFEPQGVLAGAREARRRGHDVAIVEVVAPFEINPPDLSGFDLEDEETGELVELPDKDALDRFAFALATHRERIDEAARSVDAVVIRTTTVEPFESIIMRAIGAKILGGGVT